MPAKRFKEVRRGPVIEAKIPAKTSHGAGPSPGIARQITSVANPVRGRGRSKAFPRERSGIKGGAM